MNISTILRVLKVIDEMMELLNDIEVHTYVHILSSYIKTHDSELQGQEEAACMHRLLAHATTTVSYLHGWQL